MTDETSKSPRKIAQELRELIDSSPSEETIHRFFEDKIFSIGQGNPQFTERFIMGTASKFPITPDRIPDFTIAMLNTQLTQRQNRITFIELKRPDSSLYTSHARMSKDLNDAWMECVETSRLMAENFRDCLRRLIKTLNKSCLKEFEANYKKLKKIPRHIKHGRDFFISKVMPWCNSVILIGRRSTLNSEELLRTQELSASTGQSIRVITYDAVLDWIAEAGEDDYRGRWSPFMRNWYL